LPGGHTLGKPPAYPHAYLQDCAILAGSLLTLFQQFGRLVRISALVLLLPFAYIFVIIGEGAVIAALYLLLLIALGMAELRPLETGSRR
jgi:hypothetical protein